MTANLIGFAVGIDGVTEMFNQLFKWDGINRANIYLIGLYFLVSIFIGLFTGAHCMFYEAAKQMKNKSVKNY